MRENKQVEVNEIVLTEEEQKEARKKKWRKITAFIGGVLFTAATVLYFWPKDDTCSDGEKSNEDEDLSVDLENADSDVQDMINNKTGVTLTAEQLGRKIGVSSREVNRRLIDKGLAKRIGGGLYPTEKGKELGCFIDKTTRYGYSFSGLEWDECVADYIFDPYEFEAAKKREEEIKRIIEDFNSEQDVTKESTF